MIRKSLKRKFLFLLSYFADLYQETSIRGFYRRFYQPFYKPKTLTETLSKMAKVGEIEKKIVKGKTVYKISAKGEKLLDEIIPLEKLSNQPWDGWWRMVIFDIEERNRLVRNMIRMKLKELGFGMWQESVYITPHPVMEEMNEFFQEKNLYPRCVCLQAKKTGIKDDRILAERVFRLSTLTSEYNSLSEEVVLELGKIKQGKIKKDEGLKRLHVFIDQFEGLLLKDPFLPKELYLGHKERDKLRKLISSLAKTLF